MVHIAGAEDMPALCELWRQGFEEAEAEARFAIEEFTGLSGVYLCEENGAPAAMACAVPVTLREKNGFYLYGVTTAAALRGQGVMTRFLEQLHALLKERGAAFTVLIPQTPGLYGFYQKRGYETAFYLRRFQCEIKNNLWAAAQFDTVTLRDFLSLRQKWVGENGVLLPRKAAGAVLKDLYSSGASTIAAEYGYGVYFIEKDELFFEELFARDDHAAALLLEAARQHTGCERARGLLSSGSTLLPGTGSLEPFGMICYLEKAFSVQDAYMNLMLN
ncbi:MAG: GNAT family N-acetyltransferase [Oscillospiraceae bacterium]|nr:GNAT family N-acetyltransferase [Oscillospiraceae bacterium]